MSGWTAEELAVVESTDELRVASYRPDGSLRPGVTIWVVRVSDDVYIRSAYGPSNGWFRRAQTSGSGRTNVLWERNVVAESGPTAGLPSDVHGPSMRSATWTRAGFGAQPVRPDVTR